MASGSINAHRPKVCMLAYCDSPTALPSMLNEGASLAGAGFEVESLCLASAATPPSEAHAPEFRTRRFPVRVREFFQGLLGSATSGRRLAAVQRVLSYAEYVSRAFVHALKSGADLYAAHDLPPLLPTVLAAKLRRKPVVYRAHELWSETQAHVPFAWFWRFLDRSLVPLCDQVVTPEENRSRIYREEFGAKRPPLTVRNCPPYKSPIESTRLRDELARQGIAFSTIVLYQGLIDSMRCIEEVAEATRYFDEGVVLVIIGSGWGKWTDASSVLSGHDRIVVLPRVPYGELPPYTASADIGVHDDGAARDRRELPWDADAGGRRRGRPLRRPAGPEADRRRREPDGGRSRGAQVDEGERSSALQGTVQLGERVPAVVRALSIAACRRAASGVAVLSVPSLAGPPSPPASGSNGETWHFPRDSWSSWVRDRKPSSSPQ